MKIEYYQTDILMLDVVGFSKLSNDKQFDTAIIITNVLKETIELLINQAFLQQNEFILGFIPTGDGFYVVLHPVFAGYGVFLAISLRCSLLLAAKRLNNLFSGIRTAVHLGIAFPFKDVTGKINFVGDGLNECARLLCAKTNQSPTIGIPEDDNYVVVSESAYHQFEVRYATTKDIDDFFKTIDFKKSNYFDIEDKHKKKHVARFIECSRHVAIKPPPPPDIKERMERIRQVLKYKVTQSASIVSIGNELLNGHTTDTNATYICQQLLSIGVPVVSVYTVGDEIAQIVRALKRAAEDADIVIATGGLGPTDDDLTRQAFAEFLSIKLQLDSKLLADIRQYFEKRNLSMPERNAIQAHIPAGAEPIENPLGTAPGICAKAGNKILFALPGVPFEMKKMLETTVMTRLQQQGGDKFVVLRKIRCFGAGESVIAEKLGNLMDRKRNPIINSTVSAGVITLHIVSTASTKEQAEELAQSDIERLRSILGDLVFGVDDQTLPEVVGQLLSAQKKTVATAESCTGGLVAKLLTDVPGSSAYFTHGWITYSNKAKVEQLGVPQQLIDQYGAVSEQVASALAQSARQKTHTDFAIAITGIAGPAGGTEQKPVGLVYISVCSDNNCQTKRLFFSQTRDIIRHRAAFTALNMLRLTLKD